MNIWDNVDSDENDDSDIDRDVKKQCEETELSK